MPRFDRTGPTGQGPMGRGLGPCGAGRRRGFGSGFGCGAREFCNFRGAWDQPRRGWVDRDYTAPQWGSGYGAPQDEAQALKQEESYLRNEMAAIQKRLAELQGA